VTVGWWCSAPEPDRQDRGLYKLAQGARRWPQPAEAGLDRNRDRRRTALGAAAGSTVRPLFQYEVPVSPWRHGHEADLPDCDWRLGSDSPAR
jgi:hypothetical protein